MPDAIPLADVRGLAFRLTSGERVSGSGQYGESQGGAGPHRLSTPGNGAAGATALRLLVAELGADRVFKDVDVYA
jgi:hypothetical protein